MLRGLIVGLLLANALFWAWTQGWLTDVVGIDPQGEHEPHHLATQIDPDAIHLLAATGAAATAKPACLEAGPYTPAEIGRIEATVRGALPEGSWTLVRREKPGSWFIYMGRYTAPGAMQRKSEELKRLGVAFEELRFFPELEPGFSFGRYSRIEDAQEALKRLAAQRVRTARLVQLAPPLVTNAIRIPAAGPELQATAAGLKDQLAGKAFGACREGA
ncbi:MAG: SPOR domain-containing protein [Burkholderiales bacterium]